MVGNLILYNGGLLNRVQNEFAEMEKTFNELFSDSDSMLGFNSGYPKCNVIELDNKFIIEMAVAGLDKKDIEIKVTDKEIRIKAGKQIKYENAKYHVRELANRAFSKTISIPKTVNAKEINAKMKDGILEIEMIKDIKSNIDSVRKLEIK